VLPNRRFSEKEPNHISKVLKYKIIAMLPNRPFSKKAKNHHISTAYFQFANF